MCHGKVRLKCYVIGRRPFIVERQEHSSAERNPKKTKTGLALCWGRAAPLGIL
jgi:hypothetical protein